MIFLDNIVDSEFDESEDDIVDSDFNESVS